MITLNDYLYRGDTVLKILHNYSSDLRADAIRTGSQIDIAHSNFLIQLTELLEHNDFLTSQSQRIREFYKYMASTWPTLAFTFKGRIKSLIRAEQKFNGMIVENVCRRYSETGRIPSVAEVKAALNFRDLIAYRIVVSMPACHISESEDIEQVELKYLYEVANRLPEFLERHGGFSAVVSEIDGAKQSPYLNESVRPYYKDFVQNPTEYGYRSLHVTFYDNMARGHIEVQIRTKAMDDFAEIGPANHLGYEKRQENTRARRSLIPEGVCGFFDEALERGRLLHDLDLAALRVNMFGAMSNNLVNDGCGLYRGRLITPYEHLSRFQNDKID